MARSLVMVIRMAMANSWSYSSEVQPRRIISLAYLAMYSGDPNGLGAVGSAWAVPSMVTIVSPWGSPRRLYATLGLDWRLTNLRALGRLYTIKSSPSVTCQTGDD